MRSLAFSRLAAAGCSLLLLSGCSMLPSASPPAPTAAPTPSAAPTVAPLSTPTTAPSPAVAVPFASPAASPVASAPSPAADASQGDVTLTIQSNGTSASYHAREVLAGRQATSDAIGTTTAVTGAIVLNENGQIESDKSKISVNVTGLHSDQGGRDRILQGLVLQTSKYPSVDFVPQSATGLPWPLPTDGTASFQLIGDLTIHGVTRPATWTVNATFAPDAVTGEATTPITLPDFGMQKPQVPTVASIEDTINLVLDFHTDRESAS